MTWKELIIKTKQMRDAQKEYFRTRSPDVLNRSKLLEKEVDEIVERGIRHYESEERLAKAAKTAEKYGFQRIT